MDEEFSLNPLIIREELLQAQEWDEAFPEGLNPLIIREELLRSTMLFRHKALVLIP